jgi:hypothetical protein
MQKIIKINIECYDLNSLPQQHGQVCEVSFGNNRFSDAESSNNFLGEGHFYYED